MIRAYVGLGANLGEPRRQLTEAIIAMSGLPETRLAGHSSFYRTAPIGFADQPEYTLPSYISRPVSGAPGASRCADRRYVGPGVAPDASTNMLL